MLETVFHVQIKFIVGAYYFLSCCASTHSLATPTQTHMQACKLRYEFCILFGVEVLYLYSPLLLHMRTNVIKKTITLEFSLT